MNQLVIRLQMGIISPAEQLYSFGISSTMDSFSNISIFDAAIPMGVRNLIPVSQQSFFSFIQSELSVIRALLSQHNVSMRSVSGSPDGVFQAPTCGYKTPLSWVFGTTIQHTPCQHACIKSQHGRRNCQGPVINFLQALTDPWELLPKQKRVEQIN